MALVTCTVLDAQNFGIQGIRVGLECLDQSRECFARLESVTDEEGSIRTWKENTSIGETETTCARFLGWLAIPHVSMDFFFDSASTTSVPCQRVIHATLHQIRVATHVLLHLDEAPRLEYVSPLPTRYIHTLATPFLHDRLLQAPSPIRLAAPRFSLSGDYHGNPTGGMWRDANTQPSRKRKRGMEDIESVKRSRLWIG